MGGVAELSIVVRAKDEASHTLDKINKSSGGLGTALKVAGAAGVVGLGALAVGAFKLGESFDDAYDAIAIGTGATGDKLTALQGDFKKVFTSVPTDMQSAATAIADLNTRTGLTGEALQDLAKQELELARLTKSDLNSTIQTTTRLFGDWGIAAEDQALALDKLFVISQQTGISIDRLAAGMVQYGAPLRQMGFSMEEAAAMMGKFEKEGVNAELVMGSMRIALGKMAREGEPVVETFQRTTQAIKDAGSVSEANAMALELFGARAGPDMAAAIREGRFEIEDLLTALDDADGAIMDTSASTKDFGESFTLMKNKLLVAVEPIVSRVFVGMSKAMEAAGPYLERFTVWLDKNIPVAMAKVEEAWKKIEPVRVAFVDGLKVILALDAKIIKFFGDHKEALIALGIALAVVAAVFLTIPVAIIAVITAIGLLSEHWDEIKAKTLEVWDSISDFLDEKFGFLRGLFEIAFTYYRNVAVFVFAEIKNYIETTINVIKDIITIVMALLKGDWSAAWEGMKQLVIDVWEGIKGAIMPAVDLIKAQLQLLWDALAGVRDLLGGAFTGAWVWISAVLNNVKDAVLAPFKTAFEGIRDAIQWVIDKIKDFSEAISTMPNLPDWMENLAGGVGGLVKKGWGLVPGGASGGLFTGLTWVGERGPELVNLPGGSRVYSNAESRQMANTTIGRQGNTYYGPVTNVIQVEGRDLEAELERILR